MRVALGLHPQIGEHLAGAGIVPQRLVTDEHSLLFEEHRTREFVLESADAGPLDFATLANGYEPAPPEDALLAVIGTEPTRPPTFRMDDAKDALERGNLLEALLAVFAHSWAHVDNTAPIVQEICGRVGWLSPVKKLQNNLAHADTEDEIRKQIARLEKLRSKSGQYAYALDVIIGEKYAALDEQGKARDAFSRALQHDPGLAATWISAGRTYPSALRYQDAWDCYDEGDRLCPQHKVVGDIQMLATRLRADHPQLF